MSKETAAAFLAKVDEDTTMQDKIKNLEGGSSFDTLQDFAATQGFIFSLDDLLEANKERAEMGLSPSGELSEAELESVAGGAKSNWTLKFTRDTLVISSY